MARFFFDISTNADMALGDKPFEYADEAKAIAEAISIVGAIAKDELPVGIRQIAVTVRDVGGRPIYKARLEITEERPEPANQAPSSSS